MTRTGTASSPRCAVAEIKTTPVEEVMDGRRSWVIATVLTYLAWQVIASHKEHKPAFLPRRLSGQPTPSLSLLLQTSESRRACAVRILESLLECVRRMAIVPWASGMF
uniref:Uncharacterized protein n=1 Tax=Timema bartmani TaxID=61472 RepID=A0A7R9F4N3_9NEOP|nr:unnamed protein product [Timema bartmani]